MSILNRELTYLFLLSSYIIIKNERKVKNTKESLSKVKKKYNLY